MKHSIAVERLYECRPIIKKIARHPWENRVTFNPACALVTDRDEMAAIVLKLPFSAATKKALRRQPALSFLLYRAQGERTGALDHSRSSLGLAVLSPKLELLARHKEPVLLPEKDYENLGVEDGRITKIGRRYVLVYTAYSSATPNNKIRIALASSTDFVTWEKHGLLKGDFNNINNKNGIIFERKIGRKFVMLHRPMEGKDAMAIHWAESDGIHKAWESRGVLMKPIGNQSFVDTWIGGGAPPLKLPDGRYLILYHIGNRKVGGSKEYDLGIAIGDPAAKDFIVKRMEPLMRPETAAETTGDPTLGVNNVLFVCGAYFYKGDLYFPYAGADSVVLGGKIPRSELEKFIAN